MKDPCIDGLDKHVISHDPEINQCLFCAKKLDKIKQNNEDVEIN